MPNIRVYHEKCDLCKLCVEHCPAYVFYVAGDRIAVDEDKCIECYGCVPLCPHNAIEITAEDP